MDHRRRIVQRVLRNAAFAIIALGIIWLYDWVLSGMADAPSWALAIKWIALFRLALPDVILRYAGGREITLRDLQAMGMTAGINALIVGNYLTTLGRAPAEDLQMLADLTMPIAVLSTVL